MNEQVTAADSYRVRFVIDQDARFEECNGEARPLTEVEYAENEYMKDGQPIPYADYLAYYGNPERHVYVGCIVEKRCGCCGTWTQAASLWNIDMMDDSPELTHLHRADTYTPEQAKGLIGYFAEVAMEVLDEAGYKDVANG